MTMNIDPQIVAELRSMFKDGATPSRLIRYIIDRYRDHPYRHSLIQNYFFEAFLAPMVRIADRHDDFQRDDLRYARFNHRLLFQILVRRGEWDSEEANSGEAQWLDGLTATDEYEAIQRIQPETIPELAASWDKLDEKAQKYVQTCIGNANTLFEQVKILARLAERLQQRVNALEQEVSQAKVINSTQT